MNPVHPPSSIAPTSVTPGPTNHPGTPLSTITGLTGKQPLGLPAPPSDGSLHQSIRIPLPVPCSLHCSVNKHFTVNLCLLDCFLH
ncbi:hypothetical protein ATANTOWER_032921, partial [Ataeniobius toweri]|nr:hypothetical protein [Ataeniobius toweri]